MKCDHVFVVQKSCEDHYIQILRESDFDYGEPDQNSGSYSYECSFCPECGQDLGNIPESCDHIITLYRNEVEVTISMMKESEEDYFYDECKDYTHCPKCKEELNWDALEKLF